MRLPIITAPDPFLDQKSAPVETITDEIRTLIRDLFDTMYAANGIGLAAVQVGVLKKVIVIDIGWREGESPDAASPHRLALINAELVGECEDWSSYNEGCLSFPGQYSDVERPARATVRYLDENGTPQLLTAEGLLATCLQHEIDHTNGITFVRHISPLKRDMILRKLKKAKKLDQDPHHHDHVHGPNCNHNH